MIDIPYPGWGEHAYETSTAAHQQPVQPVVDHNQQPVHNAVPPQQVANNFILRGKCSNLKFEFLSFNLKL